MNQFFCFDFCFKLARFTLGKLEFLVAGFRLGELDFMLVGCRLQELDFWLKVRVRFFVRVWSL